MINKALKKASEEIEKSHKDFKITDIYDLRDSWLFCWNDKDDSVVLSDNLSIEVEKDSLKSKVFLLPDIENFERLKKAVKIKYGSQS